MGKRKTKGTPDEIDVYAGQKLRDARTAIKLSQEKLADAIGLTFQQIQKYERGINRMSAGRLYKFSKILGVPVTFFFPDETEGKAELVTARILVLQHAMNDIKGLAKGIEKLAKVA